MASHHEFKQGDTAGSIIFVTDRGLGSTIDTADAVLNARDANGNNVVDAADVTISSVTTAGDGTKGATFTADLADATGLVTDTGFRWLELVITYTDETVQRIPAVAGQFTAEVTPNFEPPVVP